MPKKITDGSSRVKLIGCRLSETDFERAKKAAAEAEKTPSMWLSDVAVDALNEQVPEGQDGQGKG